tara:strand:- start:614 stop:1534 length:921 start_codon:yes stop_codon:yes gene_type:complete
MFKHFYNKSIRNTVIAFGTLFNNIKVVRKDSSGSVVNRVEVPLSYAAKEKFIQRFRVAFSDPDVSMQLPRIGFNITSMTYNGERKRQTTLKRQAYVENQVTDGNLKDNVIYHYTEVPYDIEFSLYVMTSSMDDGLQILEQILPYFTPEYTVTIKPSVLSDGNEKMDIPIVLNSVTSEEEYEGSFDSRRVLIWTLTFTAKTHIYPQVRKSGIIREVMVRNIMISEKDGVKNKVVSAVEAFPVARDEHLHGTEGTEDITDWHTEGRTEGWHRVRFSNTDGTDVFPDDNFDVLIDIHINPDTDDLGDDY